MSTLPYATGTRPLSAQERGPLPTLEGAFARFETTIARRRRRRGFRQSYLCRGTPAIRAATLRMLGEKE